MLPSSPTTIAAPLLPTVVDPQDNELVKRGRIKTPKDLTSTHQTLFQEDLESSRKRAIVQAMVDGEAPYSAERERASGQAGRANINWLQATDAVSEAERPYNTILESLDTFGTAPTTHGDDDSRARWEPIMAEEIARTIRLWPSFFPIWQQNVHLFKMDGVSFKFFEDDTDWRWKVRGLSHIKFPRRTQADVELLDIVTCEDTAYPHDLYRKVEAESILPEDERYWDRKSVLSAIKTAGPIGLDTSNWEEVERTWKDNDITYGVTANVVKVVHGWIRELDGTVSHYIARYDGEGDFLYKCEAKYKSMSALMTAFTDGVGTNGDFHSIRGTGYKLFSAAAGQNKLRNKMLDMACIEATPYLSSESEDSITDRSLQPMGPYVILNNKAQFTQNPPPAISQHLIPVMGMLDQVFASKATSSAPVSTSGLQRTQKTKYQVQAEMEQVGTLTSSGFFLYMSAWERHYKEVVRRMKNRDYLPTDPGGKEIASLRLRLVRRGVPLEAFYAIDIEAIEINTGVGKGSAAERRVVLDQLNERLYDRMDEKGRNILDKATAAAYAGTNMARQLFPDVPGQRPPVDTQIAQLENSLMSLGQPSAFEVNQNHVVHVDVHLALLYTLNTQLEEMQIELRPAIDQMEPVWTHCINDHMPLIPETNSDHARFKEALQQLGELITNSRKHLEAEDQRAAEEAEEQGMAPAEGFATGEDPLGLFRSAVDANTRAASKDQAVIDKVRAETKIKQDEARQQMAIRDTELALKVRQAAEKKQPTTQTK